MMKDPEIKTTERLPRISLPNGCFIDWFGVEDRDNGVQFAVFNIGHNGGVELFSVELKKSASPKIEHDRWRGLPNALGRDVLDWRGTQIFDIDGDKKRFAKFYVYSYGPVLIELTSGVPVVLMPGQS